VLWFDTDRDDVLDQGEAVLPDAPVELRHATAGAPTFDGVGSMGPVVARTTRSGADGRYAFTGVEFGTYIVVASVPSQGIDPSFDTDGQTDWIVGVSVASQSPGVADFAGVGGGSLNGRLVDETGAVVRTSGDVVCTWAGVDGVLGTADDTRFTTTAAADGTFNVGGVPYGSFRCGAVTTAGVSSAAVSAAVTSPTPTQVALPLPEATPTRRLPTAGADSTALLAMAGALLAIGLALVVTTRRRTA
jgi:LPXTG-motif cell wall-anchored protein